MALRTTYATVGRLQAYNEHLARERAAALAESVVLVADTGADGPAAAARTHRTVDVEGKSRGTASKGERVTARKIVCECHIDTLHAQGHINGDQWRAGIWFRQRYLLGYKTAVVTAGYGERVAGNVGDGVSSRILDARHDLGELAQVLSMLEWAAAETAAGHDLPLGRGRMKYLQSGLDLVTLYRDATRKG